MPRVSAKNQVTIPVRALEEAGFRSGDEVVVEALGEGELRISRGGDRFESAFGALTRVYPPGYLDRLDDVLVGALDATDRHHARARGVFTDWHRRSETLVVSVLNLSEVLVAPAPEAERLRRARAAIAALGLAIHRPTEAIGVEAARLRDARAEGIDLTALEGKEGRT